jgi:hypothetical protein
MEPDHIDGEERRMSSVNVPAMSQTTSEVEHDWRFAELVARSWVNPDLAVCYREDPHSVLAEFELRLDAGAAAPPLPTHSEGDLLIEDLDHCSAIMLPTGFCNAGLAVEDLADPPEV